ncbi:uncharacterized protein LOC130973232 isoform X2 [Arachis stenosperma]|uniref:uncharacterized protein isoform X2 n=1 Tax=Arachis hypogaea TaxID=3818 RepID=UPI000DED0698|nr:uncharacterized protein LOC112797553 isoform X2 [Arachis hypogaea]XP_057753652.1 uncharacterized protein LOC130973232 isoform X2 [Arachis stenosperma]
MLSLFPFSRIMLRYALLQIPNSVPHSALGLCFPSTSSLHSHSQPQSLDEAVDSFTRMLFMCRPPSILQFPKILGSLAKTNHCPTAISLFQQLQSRMEKKREIVELYRERLDNTLASPHMTNYHMLKNLVQTQLLHSSKQQGRTEFGFQRWEWLMVDEVQNDQTATA